MESHNGGSPFISPANLAKYLKRSRDAMPELLRGLDYLETGRGRQYFIPDIASRLMEMRRS